MFSALRHRTAALALGVCFILPYTPRHLNLAILLILRHDILLLSFRDA